MKSSLDFHFLVVKFGILTVLLLTLLLVMKCIESDHYRQNAMDLCAWHARRMYGDDVSSPEATSRWKSIVSGKAICPFCGQKHDSNWISRNAWDSQVNAMSVD